MKMEALRPPEDQGWGDTMTDVASSLYLSFSLALSLGLLIFEKTGRGLASPTRKLIVRIKGVFKI